MIVGTAGHIDHGKTALIEALTGTDADRLAEEKARGITIDLGFAYADLGDGSLTGFVDVPGHEKLIHTMVAGAGGVDLALIVIAADDGIMPQTREHLAILSLLGVSRAVVAISKADLADADRIAALHAEIAAELAATPMAGAPMVAVSARTGQGIADLRGLLAQAAADTVRRDAAGQPRLIVDRSFTMEGTGTVVTGILRAGRIGPGDHLTISPSGQAVRVRGVRAQNRPVARAEAGMRVALNLAGVAKDQVGRGDVVLAPELHAPTDRMDAVLRWIAPTPLRSGMRARLHIGTAEAEARIVPLNAYLPGGELVQLVLDRPLALGWGDAFILRDGSASRTLGGGRVLDLRAPARRRGVPDRHAALSAMALADPAEALAALLEIAPFHVALDVFLRDRALAPDAPVTGAAVILGPAEARIALSLSRLAALQDQMSALLASYHADNPDHQGIGQEALRLSLTPRLPVPGFAALLRQEADAGRIAVEAGFVRLPGHAPSMGPEDEALYARILPLLSGEGRFRPPRVRDLAETLDVPESETRRLLKLAQRLGRVDQIARDHFFLRTTTAEMAAIIRALSDAALDGWFGAPAFRDQLQNGRKVAIEILDFYDRLGLTLRRGDLRRVNPHRARLF
ncbi:selenocysteine-specific translation elongation factor [uncultured Paracoccus sp.]|uniref:selenocysteine-specific translation elongation factor n=1 Tax=Paracoccus sp. S1E-3 TaxID=2756130 RepID=UPI0015EF2F36|nr:selenocysteine-specific translation elongation factor [uncultured Paracoccus sp.]MBA4489471.1 selenocysteine-specific translation elongation factor [Paracoccus sp. S1E-3]